MNRIMPWQEPVRLVAPYWPPRVAHTVGILKHPFGWQQVEFRGLAQNAQYAYAAVACVNLYQHRDRLLDYLEGRREAVCFG